MKIYTTTREQCWMESVCRNVNDDVISTSLETAEESDTEWKGFGGCFNELSMIALQKTDKEAAQQILDDLFSPDADGLRFSFCRLPVGASDYAEKWYSYDETEDDYELKDFSIDRDRKYLLPYVKEALKRNPDMSFFASPWSPPTWMKTKKACNYGTLIQTDKNLSAYADYLCRYIRAYEKEGVRISQLHVQNEPVSDQKFPSCIWTGDEFIRFIGDYLGPAFDRENIDTEIWLGTLNGPETDYRAPYTRYNDYANKVLHDETAFRYVAGVSYQWAGKYALAITRNSFPEKKYIQSENECGDGKNTWEYAGYIFEMFHHYITNGVCAYVYWNMVLERGGISTWGWSQNSMITIDPDTGKLRYEYEYYIMKHFARFVREGAKTVKLKGHLSGNAVCFRNTDGSEVLIVRNPFDRKVKFLWKGEEVVLEPDSVNTIC